jgi:hypothetical protein
MKRCSIVLGLALVWLLSTSGQVFGQGNNPLISVNEAGTGSLLFPGGTPIPTAGALAPTRAPAASRPP